MDTGTDPAAGVELPWRKVMIVSLVAVVAGVALSYFSQRPAGVALMRGSSDAIPQVTAPKDETMPAAAVSFEWKRTTESTRLVVIDVAEPQKPVIDREVAGERYEPTADERKRFVTGRSYHWYVEARGSQGRGRASAAAQFEVR
jgi:hypothetical protein